jgi:hypothetical protein
VDDYDRIRAIRRRLTLKDRQQIEAFLVEVEIARNTWEHSKYEARLARQAELEQIRLAEIRAASAAAAKRRAGWVNWIKNISKEIENGK